MAKPDRISNREMGGYVSRREPFRNSKNSCFGKWRVTYTDADEDHEPGRYVVYSYGEHSPMYIWDEDFGWLGNADRNSPTTNMHMRQAEPGDVRARLTTNEMIQVATWGYVSWFTSKFPLAQAA